MQPRRHILWKGLAPGLLVALLAIPPAARAAYQRRWFSVDGGGLVASAGGAGYRLGGTVGQPDAGLLAGGGYHLRGGFWSGVAGTGFVGVDPVADALPTGFRALAPSPNPSRDGATLSFEIPTAREVSVEIRDVQGRRIRQLDRSRREPGATHLYWDGRDDSGARAPRGLYFVHIVAGTDRGVAKVVLLSEGGAR